MLVRCFLSRGCVRERVEAEFQRASQSNVKEKPRSPRLLETVLSGMLAVQSTGNLRSCVTASPRTHLHRGLAALSTQAHTACSVCQPVTTLPNGLEVCYASKYDVSFLYREIFEEQTYLRHGVQLAEGGVVVDVGGNIGFFALFAAGLVGSSGKVITAEPIPTLQDKLSYNINSHQTWCTKIGVSVANIVLLPLGVGSGMEKTMDFTFFPAAAGWSTMYPDEAEVQGAMQIFLERSLSKLQGIDSSWLTTAGHLLQEFAPKWLTQLVERLFVSDMWHQQQRHTCNMTTVSDIVQDHGLSHVDLLKIDVERAELDVLLGIQHADWELISQIVLEVHDLEGRLAQVSCILKDVAKFASVTVTQDEALKGSTLYNIYGTRAELQGNKVPKTKQTAHSTLMHQN